MDYFGYKNNRLFAEDVDVNTLAARYGTPLYVYSKRTMVEHFRKIVDAFTGMDALICYSVKACSNIAILKAMEVEGAGFDIVSGGELFRALKTGVDPRKIVYAGVGKTKEEIKYALKTGILMFNVESAEELQSINAVAKSMNKKADVALRINPDVEPHTHDYVATGRKESKFGIDIVLARTLFGAARKYRHINLIGVDMHIGSQITTLEPYLEAIKKVGAFIQELRADGAAIEYFNIGGGLGIIYSEEKPATADSFANAIKPLLAGLNLRIILEPGRFIVGNGGILVASVVYNKKGRSKNFLIVDAGMNDLIRPSLYGAYHRILPVNATKELKGKLELYDIVGPICESADFLGKDRHLPHLESGDLIAVRSAGAYCFAMSSNYNSRPRAAEVMVSGSKASLIRKRETWEDLVELEKGGKQI
jgi:diaminopimelate decarboxylase